MSKLYIKHASELVTCKGTAPKHGKDMSDIGIIEDGAVLVEDGIIKRCKGTVNDSLYCQITLRMGEGLLDTLLDQGVHLILGRLAA